MKEKQTFFALLGNGQGTIGIPNTVGKVWVRFQSGADSDGNVTYTPPKDVNAGTNNYFEYDGSPIRVGFDDNGELEVKRSDSKKARDAGLDTRVLNTGNPINKWQYIRNIANFKSLAPGSSTVVSVRSLLYDDNYGDLSLFDGTRRLADKIDLASFIPSAGNHRVVCLFLRTTDNTIQSYGSTTQSIATDLDLTDYQECFAQRDAESIPIQAYILQNAQSSISMLDSAEDLRQIFNMPQALGFPNPVDKNLIIRDGRTVRVCDDLTVSANLTIAGKLICNSITTTGIGSVTTTGTGSLTTKPCDTSPVLIEIDDTDSPYTATTHAIDIDIVADTTSGDITINLPPVANNLNRRYSVTNVGAGTVTLSPDGSDTIIGETSQNIDFKYDSVSLLCTSQEWILK
jgi:hypothetical protein